MTAGLQVAWSATRVRSRRAWLSASGFAAAVLQMAALAAGHPLEDLPPGHWYEAPNSKLESVDPCPSGRCSWSGIEGQAAVLDDWNGGAFATRYGTKGGYIVWGGGHRGYYGNEIYVFDIEQLKWVRVTEPVENPVCNYNEGELQDGSPCSPHTYDYVDYHPGTNSFVKLGSTSNHDEGGGGSPRVHLFSFDTGKWRRGARRPDFADQTGASSAYDPKRDVFWFLGPFNNWFSSYDPNANGGAGAWTNHQRYNIEIDAVAAIDPERDLYVVVEGRVTKQVIVFDLKRPGDRPVVVQTSGDRTIQNSKGHGFEWDPVSKAFVGWAGGTSVYVLRPPSGDWRTGTWQWTRVDAAPTNKVNPGEPNRNGTYSRWRYVPAYNVFVVVNRVDENVFFYRLDDAPPPPQVYLQATDTEIPRNAVTTLTWSAQNADSCTASGGWSGSKPTSGTQQVGPLTGTTSFTLTCSRSGGASASQTVNVNVAANVPPPSVSLSVSPSTVAEGETSVISWSVSDATSCTASGGTSDWPGAKSVSGGSQTVGPFTRPATFVLSCTGPGGTKQTSAQVNLVDAPVVDLRASASSVESGNVVTLSWSSSGATSCVAEGNWSGNKPTSGSEVSPALTSDATFVLRCTGPGGTVTKAVDVGVEPPPWPPMKVELPPNQDPPSGGEQSASTGGGGALDLLLLLGCMLVLVARWRSFGLLVVLAAGSASAAPITSVVVSSSSGSSQSQVPVTFGQVFAPGDVPAGAKLVATTGSGSHLALQVDAKARHADGSLRHAILSFRLPSLGAGASTEIMLATGTPAGGGPAVTLSDLLATSFDAEARLTVGGVLYRARARDFLSSGKVLQWLAGPVASEWIVGGPVRNASGTEHPHLAAYFHVRAYGPAPVDRVRVDVVIENGWTFVHGPGTFSYSADIRVGGQSVYQRTIDHYHHARWHRKFWWPSAPAYDVRHDTRYLQATRAVPTYANIQVPGSYLSSLLQDSTPMQNGDLTRHFPDTGAQDQIGPLPRWAAVYIVSGGDPRAMRNLLANDDSAGSYSVHFRDEDTGYPVSIADHPMLTLQTNEIPAPSGGNPNTEDGAHQPSIGFVSYLITGDYFYLEEMQFWTSWNHLWANAGTYRQGAKGIFGSQVRNQAWSLRNLAQAAYATPDDHPLKAHLVASVGYNIENYEKEYSSNPRANALGAVHSYDGYDKLAPWMDDFLTWTLAYLVDLGFDAREIRDWKLKFPVNRMGNQDYCYQYGAVYRLVVGTSNDNWFPDFRTLYERNFGSLPATCPEGLRMDGYPDAPDGYVANLRPALAAAVDAGYPGAAAAWQRLAKASAAADFSTHPVWAIVPRSELPKASPSLSLSASPTSVASGGRTTLSWSAANVISCAASGGWNGSRGVSGSETVGPLEQTTGFTLLCDGDYGTVERTVTVEVTGSAGPGEPPPAQRPQVSLMASATQVGVGGQVQLSWSASSATSCAASQGWSGTRPVTGSETVGPLNADTTFRLQCSGPGGVGDASVKVSVVDNDSPPVAPPEPPSEGSPVTPPAGEVKSPATESGGGGAFGIGALLMLAAFAALRSSTFRRTGLPHS